MKHIPTCKVVRGFRSGGSYQGLRHREFGRILTGYAEILDQDVRRQWLKDQWQRRNTGM